MTIEATRPGPYIHLDDRALVVHDSRGRVVFDSSVFSWLGDALQSGRRRGATTSSQPTANHRPRPPAESP